jgi:hypothetical protein
MEYVALTSFSGSINMVEGEKRELTDKNLIKDLTRAGYIMPFQKIEKSKPAVKTKKGGKK